MEEKCDICGKRKAKPIQWHQGYGRIIMRSIINNVDESWCFGHEGETLTIQAHSRMWGEVPASTEWSQLQQHFAYSSPETVVPDVFQQAFDEDELQP